RRPPRPRRPDGVAGATPMPADDSLESRIRALREDFEAALASAVDPSALQSVRDRFLGRKAGAVTALLKALGGLAEDARREAGRELNALKTQIEGGLEAALERVERRQRGLRVEAERLDLTLPGRVPPVGRRHPLTAVRYELEDIFV